MAVNPRGGLRCITRENGVRYVMIYGVMRRPGWCAANWASQATLILLTPMLTTDRVLGLSGWTMQNVWGVKALSSIAAISDGVFITVCILKMWVSIVPQVSSDLSFYNPSQNVIFHVFSMQIYTLIQLTTSFYFPSQVDNSLDYQFTF